MTTLRNALTLALLASACLLIYDLHLAVVHTTARLDQTLAAYGSLAAGTQADVSAMRTQVDRVVIIVAGLATNIEKATRGLNAQQAAEVEALRRTTAAAQALLADTSRSLNGPGGVLPSLAATVAAVNDDARRLGPVLDNTRDAAANLVRVTDPVLWEPTAHDLQAMSANGVVVSGHIAAISDNFDAISGDLRGYTHRAVQPRSKAYVAWMLASSAFPLLAHALP